MLVLNLKKLYNAFFEEFYNIPLPLHENFFSCKSCTQTEGRSFKPIKMGIVYIDKVNID